MIRWLTLAATAAMITVNGLANALPIGGKTTGQIADGFAILFTPAGYVFSIWGLIYLGLMAFSLFQLRRDTPELQAARPWYLLNTMANAGWIFAWHHEIWWLTLPIMLTILGSLIAIYRHVGRIAFSEGLDYFLIRAPFALYLGWISVATIANTTVVLWVAGWSEPLTSEAVTLAILVAATGLCVGVSSRIRDPIYAGVFVWALAGIAQKHAELSMLFPGAVACAAICAGIAVWSGFSRTRAAP